MAKKFKRSYKFAVKTSLYISIFLTLLSAGVLLYFHIYSEILLLVYGLGCFLFSFLIIQYRVEFFIYKKIKKIYENVSVISASSLKPHEVTTDMNTLSLEVQKFAEGKKLEIQALKVRESYRKEFMGNIAHELKTPIFTVQGYLETLLDGALEDENVNKQYLSRAAKGVERLVYIVEDLDMITRLETGELQLNIEVFDVVELIKGVFELLEMKAAKKDISLIFDTEYPPRLVKADKERVQQILINLITNSIKYGKRGGTTEVIIRNFSKKKIKIKISDNGEGIQKEHIPRLFERFYRVDKSGSRKEGGSGLGLAIVKHLLEAHQERIFVESSIGLGSEFSFTLKKAKKSPEVTTEIGRA